MKFSEAWLREWVSPGLDTVELTEQLTMAGLEVDSMEPVAAEFSDVVVAEVLTVDAHPDADKLRVCQVSTGEGDAVQIVCGAPNVRAGMKAPLARVGGRIGDMKLKKAKLRGVVSQGMLCSARELGLSDDHQGLMDLPADAPLGADLREYLALDDTAIDVDLTPNRGDCLGVAGIAREVGALTRSDVTPPPFETVAVTTDATFPVSVTAPHACPRYLGRVIEGIDPTVATPVWMQEKLRRSGIRSLGPVVDITNYVLLELGQPMHAFDLDRLSGGIEVRMARHGEQLTLLDESSLDLDDSTLLICDHQRPVALAGIMGGLDSGISDATRRLFLEVAFFSPQPIAGKARAYGLTTDSAYRFERGVDPQLQARAMERATALLVDIVGGRAGPVVEAVTPEHLPEQSAILLRRARVRRLLGFLPTDEQITDILTRLGIELTEHADGWSAVAPSFRFDLGIEADLIEEIGRVFGYENLPSTGNHSDLTLRPVPETVTPLAVLRAALVERGYHEAITYSFVAAETLRLLEPGIVPIPLQNPISGDMSVMRSTLWAGLIGALKHNLARQQKRVRLFESGLKFISQDDETKQYNHLSGIVVGSRLPEQWGAPAQRVDFFDVKADVEALLAHCGVSGTFAPETHPALHPGQSARISVAGKAVGWLGCVHPEVAQTLEIPEAVFLFELDLDILHQKTIPSFRNLSRFPSIRRDLAVVVNADTPAGSLCDVIVQQAGDLLQELKVFDVYQGTGIETGRKNVAFGLILQESSRTLTDVDVDEVMTAISRQLAERFGATLRE